MIATFFTQLCQFRNIHLKLSTLGREAEGNISDLFNYLHGIIEFLFILTPTRPLQSLF